MFKLFNKLSTVMRRESDY